MHRHHLTWSAIFIVMALMFLQLPQMVAKQDAVLNTYSALVEVDALARQKFVEPIGDERLVHGAIRGMMFQLDPYSGYIAPGELSAFERRSHGDYIGVGIEVGMRNGRLTVIAPIEGSPAARAGVLAGDVILSIDGREIKGLAVFDVEELLGGTPGTAVRLRVRHQGAREPEALTIVRGPVSLQTVRGFRRDASGRWRYMIDPEHQIGYLRVSSFLDNTRRDFDVALNDLLKRGVRGLVLDLRFNPGGVMHQAVAMVDRFVERGVIVSTVTRRRAVREYQATTPGTIREVKLVVLINGGSASASEIVAGALQAHKRAMIVGQRSFGKGSVQHLIHLQGHKAAIKLTTAYYRLPDGRIIHRTGKNLDTDSWGVMPDVAITLNDEEVQAIQASRRALDLAFTGSSAVAETPEAGATNAAGAPSLPREILRDRQLVEALSHLRRQLDAGSSAGRS